VSGNRPGLFLAATCRMHRRFFAANRSYVGFWPFLAGQGNGRGPTRVPSATTHRAPGRLLATCAIGIHCVSGEDRHANQGEYGCGGLDHRAASCGPIAARYLLHDWFQIRSKMNCILAVPVLLLTKIT